MARNSKQLLPWLFSGLLLMAALSLVVVKIRERRDPGHGGPEPHDMRLEQKWLAATFEEAKSHIREDRFTEAKSLLLELQATAPDYPSLQDYLERVEKEIPNQQHLEAARKALAEKKLAVTSAELAQVRADTVLFEQVSILQRNLRESVNFRASEAQTLFDARKYTEAQALVDDVLAADPQNPPALQVSGWLRQRNEEAASTPPPLPQDPDPTEASRFYQAAVAARATGQWAQAFSSAQRTLEMDASHAGATHLLSELRVRAKELYLQAYALKDSDPKEAIPKFREVMKLTLPDDEIHQKAKKWLEKLQG